MSQPAHIVVVDDDDDLRESVQDFLIDQGYIVSQAPSAAELRAIMKERPVDLAILDVRMPEEDGISLARDLRSRGRIGIIMLTANTDTVDKIIGLEVGADDYVTKPYDPRELLARVRSVLRRVTTETASPATMGNEVAVGKCVLNLDSRRLFERDGTEVPLTAMEFDLLRAFVQHPNRVLSRDQLLDLAHNKEADVFDRSIDTRMVIVRQKVEVDPARPQVLKTVRGAGYIFTPGG